MSVSQQVVPPRRPVRFDLSTLAPFIALVLLIALGTAVNPRFLEPANLSNVVTRSAFIAIIATGATFVIAAGGLDLSVGAMSAFVGGIMILLMNATPGGPLMVIAAGIALALVGGGVCGLGNGLITTMGRIEPFIVTLGTMSIFRALITYLAQGGAISLQGERVQDLLRPVYFGTVLDIPVPVLIYLGIGGLAWVVLNRTAFGRHCVAVGANEDVARYSGVAIGRVRSLTYVIQGVTVGLATILYVPRLSSVTPSSGLLWELQAITAVVIGGTPLRGGAGRIWGSITGAIILDVVANIMVLSNQISEYLIGAVQGAIIIIAMLVQRSLRKRT